jgi:uncharacterized hydantoinase/oxoprolinase family protein
MFKGIEQFISSMIPKHDIQIDWLAVTANDLVDNPIAANKIAQVIFDLPDDDELNETELFIVGHIVNTLKIVDEIRMKQKKCPLAQEYHNLPSKELH